MAGPKLSEKGIIILLCVINLFNYIDRGIIPGAPEKFQHFMTQTLDIGVTEQNLYLGLLTTAFIASEAVCSVLFGYLSLFLRPFRIIAFGMAIWVISVILCGISYYVGSYYLLLFGRILSGVGEASFHCNGIPFINRHAPKENNALWMGIFITSITVGMAVGYVYGSAIAASPLGWAGAFFIEGFLMSITVILCLWSIPEELDQIPNDATGLAGELSQSLLVAASPRPAKKFTEDFKAEREGNTTSLNSGIMPASASVSADLGTNTKPAFARSWWNIIKNPVFCLIIFGHGMYIFTLGALSVFIPIILINLGMFDSELDVSLAFGGIIVVSGTIGTVFGGVLLDHMTKKREAQGPISRTENCVLSVTVLVCVTMASFIFSIGMMSVTESKYGFLILLAISFFFFSAAGPAEQIGAMALFPESRHAMAVAANTLVVLLLGEVPAPIITGYFKDLWAPRCGTIELNGTLTTDPLCYLDRTGLENVLWFCILWSMWAILLWALALLLLKLDLLKGQNKAKRYEV